MKRVLVSGPDSRKPKCVCGKIGFDKKTAQSKRNYLEKGKGKYKGRELRIYKCPESDLWHLTSTHDWFKDS